LRDVVMHSADFSVSWVLILYNSLTFLFTLLFTTCCDIGEWNLREIVL
jgi:hypothetical protein